MAHEAGIWWCPRSPRAWACKRRHAQPLDSPVVAKRAAVLVWVGRLQQQGWKSCWLSGLLDCLVCVDQGISARTGPGLWSTPNLMLYLKPVRNGPAVLLGPESPCF